MTAPSRSQQFLGLSALSNSFDACLELYADSLANGTQDDPIVDNKPPRGSQRPGRRHQKELSHEQRIEQKLDRIITLLERLND